MTHLNKEDVAPGFMERADHGARAEHPRLSDRPCAGGRCSRRLRSTSVYTDLIWAPAIPSALVVLAVAQIGVHLVFFLHLTTAPDNTNNVLALAFGVLIVALIIGGSVWIMDHLNQNMMPMHQMMQMQR